jgi:hypothetical protein
VVKHRFIPANGNIPYDITVISRKTDLNEILAYRRNVNPRTVCTAVNVHVIVLSNESAIFIQKGYMTKKNPTVTLFGRMTDKRIQKRQIAFKVKNQTANADSVTGIFFHLGKMSRRNKFAAPFRYKLKT